MTGRPDWRTVVQAAKQGVRSHYKCQQEWSQRGLARDVRAQQTLLANSTQYEISNSPLSTPPLIPDDPLWHGSLANLKSMDDLDQALQAKWGATVREPVVFNAQSELLHQWSLGEYWNRLKQTVNEDVDCEVNVGDDDEEYQVTVPLHSFFQYVQCDSQEDDDPLLLFQEEFHDTFPGISSTYQIPACFQWTERVDPLARRADRPPYHWLLFGGPRSGIPLHVDPYGSHAWNALVQGQKRWLCFPPSLMTEQLEENDSEPMYSMTWYQDHYQTFLEKVAQRQLESSSSRAFEWVQQPGQVVFVPQGWYHMVLNVTETLAVTYNFTTEETNELPLAGSQGY